jgi:uncharacterized protein YndB with AHSA1/START domain
MNNTGTFAIAPRGEREIVMTRVFDAPRHIVFDAFTKPAIIRQWLTGPDGWSMPICDLDLRVGGAYRWTWRNDSDGREMTAHGVFREVAPPERIVHTERFDPSWYPDEAVVTTYLAEQGGRTSLTVTLHHGSAAARDMVLKSGMERGVAQSYDRLERMLTSGVVNASH